MQQTLTTQATILITAASVTAELNGVNEIAKDMTLGVMNAKTISHRAGESAKGFQPITDYIEQVAREVAQAVVQISKGASVLARLAVSYHHKGKVLSLYRHVMKDAGDAAHVTSLVPVIKELTQNAQKEQAHFLRDLEGLVRQLDSMKNTIRSSKVISTISRVEAASSDSFRKNLEVVADDLESSTEKIRERVQRCHHQLTDVRVLVLREGIS